MEQEQEKKLIEEILHKVQMRAIIVGVPALLAIFFTMFSVLNSGKQGPIGPKGAQGPIGVKGERGLDGIPAKIPTGAVVPFNLDHCPNGWKEYALAYGRFIRGIDKSQAGIDPKTGRNKGDLQNFSTALPTTVPLAVSTSGQHTHTLTGTYANGTGGNRSTRRGNGDVNPNEYNDSNGVGQAGNHSHLITGGDIETRPKNVALLYCEKVAQ